MVKDTAHTENAKSFLIYMQNIERKSEMIGLAFDRSFKTNNMGVFRYFQKTPVRLIISLYFILLQSCFETMATDKSAMQINWINST